VKLRRQLYEGTTLYQGNTVTVIGRQALSIGGDTDDNIKDLDYAFDPTLGGLITYDFGDLPSSYGATLLSNSGAQHKVTPGAIHLGAGITTEPDGTQSATAAADGSDDGVTLVSTVFGKGGGAYVDVTASAAGWVIAWIDFNGDGDFDDVDEMIIDQSVSAGINHLFFYVSPDIPDGLTDFFSRFRIYPTRPAILVPRRADDGIAEVALPLELLRLPRPLGEVPHDQEKLVVSAGHDAPLVVPRLAADLERVLDPLEHALVDGATAGREHPLGDVGGQPLVHATADHLFRRREEILLFVDLEAAIDAVDADPEDRVGDRGDERRRRRLVAG